MLGREHGPAMLDTARTIGGWTLGVALLPARLALDAGRRGAERAIAAAVQEALDERFIERLLDAPQLERIVVASLESPGMERLVTRIVESHLTEATMARLIDDATAQLPQSKALWALIDQVAQSPAVTDAISSQTRGLADEVASDLRDRSRDADAWLERAARRVFRQRGGGPATGMPAPQTP